LAGGESAFALEPADVAGLMDEASVGLGAEAGLCNGTLDGDCAAIAHRHRQEDLGDPTAAAVVRRVRSFAC
jgi:hypothetical protein